MILHTKNGDKLCGTTSAFLQNISKLLWHLAVGVLVFWYTLLSDCCCYQLVVPVPSPYFHQFNDDDIHTRSGPYSSFGHLIENTRGTE
jgi:hypothetical protein